MNKHDEWNEFLENLFSGALEDHKASQEGKYLTQRKGQIDKFLSTNLTDDQKSFMDDILFELGLAAERETETLYRQGMKDCVWLLKTLGVLA